MKINNTALNFNGYKNLVHTKIQSQTGELTLLALQLNDNDGKKDLTNFKKLLKDENIPETDVMTFVRIKTKNGEEKNVLNDVVMLNSEELELLGYPKVMKDFPKFNPRANALMESITERLSRNEGALRDCDMKHTILEIVKVLQKSFSSIEYVMDILDNAFFEKSRVYKIAEEINACMLKNKRFFKI